MRRARGPPETRRRSANQTTRTLRHHPGTQQLKPTWSVLGFIDDAPQHPERVERLDMTVPCPVKSLTEHPAPHALGIGTSAARRRLSVLLGESGDDVFLGTGAIVTRGCTVGSGVRIGAGAVVLDDVAAGATVYGIPAMAIDLVGERLGVQPPAWSTWRRTYDLDPHEVELIERHRR